MRGACSVGAGAASFAGTGRCVSSNQMPGVVSANGMATGPSAARRRLIDGSMQASFSACGCASA
jgi:hypothetical protein